MTEQYAEFMERIYNMPRSEAHEALYLAATGKKLDLEHPKDLNEKLQWLMVNRYDSNVSLFADKLAVRDYVRSCGYGDILTELYGAYESGEAAYRAMTGQTRYVLKCTHGSGPNFISICRDRESFDLKKETDKLGRSLSYDYSRVGLEHHYHYIRPLIIAEEYLGDAPVDYKFFCFSGEAKYVKVIAGRGNGVHQDYYDMDRSYCPFVKDEVSMRVTGGYDGIADTALGDKTVFDRMAQIASKLSEPFAVARVDLYYEHGRIYFGEITLTPATGLNRTDKPETLELLGSLVDLSYDRPELYDFPRTDETERMLGSFEASGQTGPDGQYAELVNSAAELLAEPQLLLKISRQDALTLAGDCIGIIDSDVPQNVRDAYMAVLQILAGREDMQ